MKIVQLNTTYGLSDSTGRNVKELHQYFQSKGEESFVFTTQYNDSSSQTDKNVFRFSNSLDQKTHALLSRISGLQGYYSKVTTKKLLSDLNNILPNVVILNVLHSNCINFEDLFSFLSQHQVVTVLVLHDCFFYTGHCCHYVDVECTRWKHNCGHCPSMKKWNKSYFFDTSQKAIQDKKRWYSLFNKLYVITVSKWLKEDVKKSILKNAQITTIYNWIDLDTFKYTNVLPENIKRYKGRAIAIAVASFWNQDKGMDDIVEVSKKIPELTIILIGRTNGQFNQCENIISVGLIKNMDEMAKYYSCADVFLNPSKMETFGKTTAEAMACGTPVVAYQSTAFRELVDFSCGALAECGNKMDYVTKVKEVMSRGREYYSRATRKFAEVHFNGKANMELYYQFIKMAVNRNGG